MLRSLRERDFDLSRIVSGSSLYTASLVLLLGWAYTSTLLPGIGYTGDTVKFQYLGEILGIPHPTGYPLYLVLNNLFVNVFPFGSLAYKANLLSAVFAVAACVVFFRLLLYLGLGRMGALALSLSLGLSYVLWSQAVVAEVYTLHLLLMTSVMYALIRWHSGEEKMFYVATGLYALSFGNHLTSITLLPAFVYITLATNPKVFIQPRKVLWVVGVVILGALQYSYLFWRLNNEFFYAELFTGRSFDNLRDFLTGGNFKESMFAFTGAQLWSERLPLALTILTRSFPVIGLAALGVAAQAKRLHVVNFVLIYFLSHTYYAMNYNIPDIEVYFIPSIMALALLAGLGLSELLQDANAPRLALLLAVPLGLLFMNYREVDLSHITAPQGEAAAIISAVQRDAIISTSGYNRMQYMFYHTLGLKKQRDNLFVTNYGRNGAFLQSYLRGEAPPEIGEPPLLLAQEGKNPPPGLRVFCWECANPQALQKHGFDVQMTGVAGLYRLELANP